jgi:phospholipid transport system transporter-binding protein
MNTRKASCQINHNSLHLTGELDFVSTPYIYTESLVQLKKLSTLNIDLAGVTKSNSAAIALLIEWLKFAKAQQKPLHLHHIPKKLGAIIAASGIQDLFA